MLRRRSAEGSHALTVGETRFFAACGPLRMTSDVAVLGETGMVRLLPNRTGLVGRFGRSLTIPLIARAPQFNKTEEMPP